MSRTSSPGLGEAYLARRSVVSKYSSRSGSPTGRLLLSPARGFPFLDGIQRHRYSLLRGASPVDRKNLQNFTTDVPKDENGKAYRRRFTTTAAAPARQLSHPLQASPAQAQRHRADPPGVANNNNQDGGGTDGTGDGHASATQRAQADARNVGHLRQQELVDFVNQKINRLAQAGLLRGESAVPLASLSAAPSSAAAADEAGSPTDEWQAVMTRLNAVFDEVEAAADRAGSVAVAAEAERQAWETRAEEAAAQKAAMRQRAEALAAKMEDTLGEVEARLAEARAKWDRDEGAGRRRRDEDRELMLEQCRRWEAMLEGAADHLEHHTKGHNEMKFRSLALCSNIERRVAMLEHRLLEEQAARDAD